ncbi:MAG: hypothetical protein ACREJ2_09265 [Planctomycetota bacterium]
MSGPLSHLPDFPSPPEPRSARASAEVLAEFLYDLFDAGVASVVDPLPLGPDQSWQAWAEAALQRSVAPGVAPASAPGGGASRTPAPSGASGTPDRAARPAIIPAGTPTTTTGVTGATGAEAAPRATRPSLVQMLEQAHRRLVLELPLIPRAAGGVETAAPAFEAAAAVEAARRLYQVCQVLAAPQQDKDELRRSFPADFRPARFATLLSAFASWSYLPMAYDHVRQRLTVASGATPAMQEVERIIREQLALWPAPLEAVLAIDLTPDPASLGVLEGDPVGARYLAEQLLTRAVHAPSPRLAAWLTDRIDQPMQSLLGHMPSTSGAAGQRWEAGLKSSFGARADPWLRARQRLEAAD